MQRHRSRRTPSAPPVSLIRHGLTYSWSLNGYRSSDWCLGLLSFQSRGGRLELQVVVGLGWCTSVRLETRNISLCKTADVTAFSCKHFGTLHGIDKAIDSANIIISSLSMVLGLQHVWVVHLNVLMQPAAWSSEALFSFLPSFSCFLFMDCHSKLFSSVLWSIILLNKHKLLVRLDSKGPLKWLYIYFYFLYKQNPLTQRTALNQMVDMFSLKLLPKYILNHKLNFK